MKIDADVSAHREGIDRAKAAARNKTTNPIVILLGILLLAVVLTFFVESGSFERDGKLVVPNSYSVLEKDASIFKLFSGHVEPTEGIAEPVSLVGALLAIPAGLDRASGLIFMVLAIGGMFGILTKSGAVDAGLERLLYALQGNLYILVPGLMIVFSAGSTFLGLASEYLLIIPIMAAMAERLGMSRLIGFAIVTIAVKVGYLTSVTNPLPLTVAQPLLGLQVFSGADVRFIYYLVFLAVGIAFMMVMVRRQVGSARESVEFAAHRLSLKHSILLATLVLGVAVLVYGSTKWRWDHEELSAYYMGLSILLAAISGMGASGAADAFVFGMKKVLVAAMLIGVATAVSIVLSEGQILDTIVNKLTSMVGDDGPLIAAQGMFLSQLLLDFLIPSTSGQAAVSMPILGPIGQLTGVPEQTTVVAFLFGNGLTNMITPTSGTLLAYLATAQVSWTSWARFILPLWAIFAVLAMILLGVSVEIGF